MSDKVKPQRLSRKSILYVGREQARSGTLTSSCTNSLDWFVSLDEPPAFHGQNRELFSEHWI
jgi:hypothetical protein